jgi:hypothetical protein
MTPPTPPAAQVRLSRRAVLGVGAGLGVAGVAGCSVDNPLNNPLTAEDTPAAKATRDLAPDVAVAVQAVTLVRAAEAAVAATGKTYPALADRLTSLLQAHRAHLAAVVDAVPDGVDTSPTGGAAYAVPATAADALRQLTTAEHNLHDALIGLALRAQSGVFARLLGAMAAALSQQLHGLVAR